MSVCIYIYAAMDVNSEAIGSCATAQRAWPDVFRSDDTLIYAARGESTCARATLRCAHENVRLRARARLHKVKILSVRAAAAMPSLCSCPAATVTAKREHKNARCVTDHTGVWIS